MGREPGRRGPGGRERNAPRHGLVLGRGRGAGGAQGGSREGWQRTPGRASEGARGGWAVQRGACSVYAACRPWRSPGGATRGRQGRLEPQRTWTPWVPEPGKGLRAGFWAWVVASSWARLLAVAGSSLIPLTPCLCVQMRHGGTPSGCRPGAHRVPQYPPCGVSMRTGLSGRVVRAWAVATCVRQRPRGGGRGPRCCCSALCRGPMRYGTPWCPAWPVPQPTRASWRPCRCW